MRQLDVTVYEPGDTVGLVSAGGEVRLWKVGLDGELVPLDTAHAFREVRGTDPIEVLNMTVRSYNLMKREGLHTIAQLDDFVSRVGREGLLELRNCGEKNATEIIEKLEEVRA